MGELLDARRRSANDRLEALGGHLEEAKRLADDRVCVYLTGSFARGEAGAHSDLDLFIVGQVDEHGERRLSRLDEIRLTAELIKACEAGKFPPFSGDGEWLTHSTVKDLVDTLGRGDDDARNTFTARMLLLLESRPLLGEPVYQSALDEVIAAYWSDYDDHASEFLPSFLANDILRMWRTFCVNYEARTQKEPEEKKAKRKLKNYKLKHSRLLTCYSALAYMLAEYEAHGTVSREAVRAMAALSPTARLERLAADVDARPGVGVCVGKLLEQYERFLGQTDRRERELIELFMDPGSSRMLRNEANEFGDSMFALLRALGEGGRLFRMLVV